MLGHGCSEESELREVGQLHLHGSFQAVKNESVRIVYLDVVGAVLVLGYHAKDECIG